MMRHTSTIVSLAGATILLLGGCTWNPADPTTILCDEKNACPEGKSCVDGKCTSEAPPPDTGAPEQDTFVPEPDTAVPEQDSFVPEPDTIAADTSVPDAPLPDGPPADTGAPDSQIPDQTVAADGGCTSGATQACYTGGPATRNVGACQDGIQDCVGGAWGPCNNEVTPAMEICNGIDDDCNGSPDDTFACPMGTSTGCTTGCGSTGTQTCDNTCNWGGCAPPAEICNGADDDCDGVADEDFECIQGNGSGCVTGCGSAGNKGCETDCTWGPCVPPAEICNGVDDDCDGVADDGFACVKNSTGLTCSIATIFCTATGTTSCSSSCTLNTCIPPQDVCNGADDDCDGTKDEGFACVGGTVETGCSSIVKCIAPDVRKRCCSINAGCTWTSCECIPFGTKYVCK